MRLLSTKKISDHYLNDKLSCAEIAEKDGRSETTIYKLLVKNKVQMRTKSEANQIFSDNVFIFLYNLGLSLTQVGSLLGINPTTISKRLSQIGFPTRIPCLAKSIKYTNEEFKRYFCNKKFIQSIRRP